MKVLKILGGLVASALLALLAFVGVARFGDGPSGFFPGGAFQSGEEASAAAFDWASLADVDTIEFQLLDPVRSRTVWTVVYDGVAHIPCGAPSFTLWKQWPHEAVEDGRAIVRTGGRRYAVQLVKVEDPETFAAVGRIVSQKYDAPETTDPDLLWIFRIDPRS